MTVSARIAAPAWDAAEPRLGRFSHSGTRSVPEALSSLGDANDLARCLWPLLESLGWSGDPRYLVEALPHFVDGLDLESFRDVLARLGYSSIVMPRQRCDRIDPRLLPALVLSEDGRSLVISAPDVEGRILVRNPARETEGPDDLRRLRGQVCLFRRIEHTNTERQAAETGNWIGYLLSGLRGAYWRAFGLGSLATLFAVAQVLAVVAFFDKSVATQSSSLQFLLLAGLVSSLVAEAFLRGWRGRSLVRLGCDLHCRIIHGIFRQQLYQPISLDGSVPTGAKVQQLQKSDRVRAMFSGDAISTLMDLPFTGIYLVILAFVAGETALVPMGAIAACALASWLLAPNAAAAAAKLKCDRSAQHVFLFEALPLASHVRLSGAAPTWRARFRDFSGKSILAGYRVSVHSTLVVAVGKLALAAALVTTLWLGILRIGDGTLTEGRLIASLALTWLALRPWQEALPLLTRISDMRCEIADLNRWMQGAQEHDALTHAKDVSPVWSGQIQLSGVSRSHAPGLEPAIEDLNLSIAAGEILAVTGPNGAGKSTLLHLILGLYPPQIGQVLIDDIDIRNHAEITLRQSIGYVPQEFNLFYGTIRQNLLLSLPTAGNAEIEQAARRAGVHGAIMAWPDGFDHRVGDARSAHVPTTTRNGLALAAAYLRRPSILLIDEAIDNLDEGMTEAFHAEIERLRGRTTTVIVTQRPSTMRRADRLLVMNGGRIVDSGLPEDLLQ